MLDNSRKGLLRSSFTRLVPGISGYAPKAHIMNATRVVPRDALDTFRH